jgi:hypothetical protein
MKILRTTLGSFSPYRHNLHERVRIIFRVIDHTAKGRSCCAADIQRRSRSWQARPLRSAPPPDGVRIIGSVRSQPQRRLDDLFCAHVCALSESASVNARRCSFSLRSRLDIGMRWGAVLAARTRLALLSDARSQRACWTCELFVGPLFRGRRAGKQRRLGNRRGLLTRRRHGGSERRQRFGPMQIQALVPQ